jgi:anti-anti-sigma factor
MLGELLVQLDTTTVRLHGDLDMVTVEGLRALLAEASADRPDQLVVDLSDVGFVDVLSLSAILAAADMLRDRGGRLVVRGASASMRRICGLLNAQDILMPELPHPRPAFRQIV